MKKTKKFLASNWLSEVSGGEEETERLKREIQLHYQQLQNRLGEEFQSKLKEWEKMKATATPSPSSTLDNQAAQVTKRNMEGIKMLSQKNLPPEFKKKLEEWNKIKNVRHAPMESTSSSQKRKLKELPKWKSVGGSPQRVRYSDDFLKKLEEWRQIKSGRSAGNREEGASSDCENR